MSGFLRLFSAALSFFIIFSIAKLYDTAQAADYFYVAALSNFGSVLYKHGSEVGIIEVDFAKNYQKNKYIKFHDGLKNIIIISLYSLVPLSAFLSFSLFSSLLSFETTAILFLAFVGAISLAVASLYQEFNRSIGEQIRGITIATIVPYLVIFFAILINYRFGTIHPHVFFVSAYLAVALSILFRAKVFSGFSSKHFKLAGTSKSDFFVSMSIRAIEPNAAVIISKLVLSDEAVVAIAIINRIGAIIQILNSAITFSFPAEFARALRAGTKSARDTFRNYRKNMLIFSGSFTIVILIFSYQILDFFDIRSIENLSGLTLWLGAILISIALGPARLALLIQPIGSAKLISAALSTGSIVTIAIPGAFYFGVPGVVLSITVALVTSTWYCYHRLKNAIL